MKFKAKKKKGRIVFDIPNFKTVHFEKKIRAERYVIPFSSSPTLLWQST